MNQAISRSMNWSVSLPQKHPSFLPTPISFLNLQTIQTHSGNSLLYIAFLWHHAPFIPVKLDFSVNFHNIKNFHPKFHPIF